MSETAAAEPLLSRFLALTASMLSFLQNCVTLSPNRGMTLWGQCDNYVSLTTVREFGQSWPDSNWRGSAEHCFLVSQSRVVYVFCEIVTQPHYLPSLLHTCHPAVAFAAHQPKCQAVCPPCLLFFVLAWRLDTHTGITLCPSGEKYC